MEDFISFEELTSGESVGLTGLVIQALPHISILRTEQNPQENWNVRYKNDMAVLLSELYQPYHLAVQREETIEFAAELLWVTQEVQNQPYRAEVKLYLLLRSIGLDRERIKQDLQSALHACMAVLDLQKYEYAPLNQEELRLCIAQVDSSAVRAVVKEERLEQLQNSLVPMCLAFEQMSEGDQNLDRIANALIDLPNCAVSFQLIPTTYSPRERIYIENMAQGLDTLSNGIMDQGVGNVSVAMARQHAQTYRYYASNKSKALFRFNILVYGTAQDASSIASRIYAQLNTSTEGNVNLHFVELSPELVGKDTNFYPLPWAVSEQLMEMDRKPEIWGQLRRAQSDAYRLPYIITAAEAAEFFRLPIGDEKVGAGFRVNDSGKSSRTYAGNIINGADITVGQLRGSSRGDNIGFFLNDLTKHMLIVGSPGSGKTTFSVSLLDRLWKQYHIPFLVIEPAKNEYRALIQSIPDLQVFTPGKNNISPFFFNPFVPPKNVRLESYKSTLKTAFAAAVSMTTPLDKIFEETINNCYSDFRWLDHYTSDDKGQIFNISDFIKCFQDTFDAIGYSGDARNIGRAGVVRLNSLTNLFDNYFSVPIEDILQRPTVIELAAIENSDQKALLIALLLLSILSYVNRNYLGQGKLKNVVMLEEAHVLLAATGAGGQDATPSLIAQELVKRMLAEIRSYGVGLVIADQSPRKVTSDVVGLTDIKLAFRIVEKEDKQIIADSTNMSDIQMQRLGRLKPGEAFFFFHRLDEPEEVKTEDYRLENKIDITLSDEDIASLSTYWNDKQAELRPYPQCTCVPYCQKCCQFERRMLGKEIARRIFNRYFKAQSDTMEPVRGVFGKISTLVEAELNDEPFSRELLLCVKVHLWRRIQYNTKIRVPAEIVKKSLETP